MKGKVAMPKDRPIAKSIVPTQSPMQMADIPAEDESRVEVAPKIARIRDGQAYLSAALTAQMEKVWPNLAAVKTRTDVAKNLIYIFRADPSDPTATTVNRYGTLNAGVFSLYVPLQKLGLRLSADRQWEVLPYEQRFTDGPTAFVLPMADRVSVKRNRSDAEESVAPTAKTKAKSSAKAKPADADDLDDFDDEDDFDEEDDD
jgi:hypothetical protein